MGAGALSGPFKNRLCREHLEGFGWRYGAWPMACRRHRGHKGPHRASGHLEWPHPKYTWVLCVNIKTGKLIAK